jgi:hypothetical protein
MIQIDGPKRQIYVKFIDITYVHDILHTTNGQAEYKHVTSEFSIVKMPPEVTESTILPTLSPYGEIKNIPEETWFKAYRYAVAN